jgi:hypothetical protein
MEVLVGVMIDRDHLHSRYGSAVALSLVSLTHRGGRVVHRLSNYRMSLMVHESDAA